MKKSELIASMLLRPQGCTRSEVLQAIGWKQISFQAHARQAGLYLRIEKERDWPKRYFGSHSKPEVIAADSKRSAEEVLESEIIQQRGNLALPHNEAIPMSKQNKLNKSITIEQINAIRAEGLTLCKAAGVSERQAKRAWHAFRKKANWPISSMYRQAEQIFAAVAEKPKPPKAEDLLKHESDNLKTITAR